MKRIEIDGKFYRKRRGQLVEIPPEWVGKTTHKQTRHKRLSHQSPKPWKRWRDGLRRQTDVPRTAEKQALEKIDLDL